MTIVSEPAYRSRASSLALRYALRELRGGLRGFYRTADAVDYHEGVVPPRRD